MYKDCDIFTPKEYVKLLLDKINYKSNIFNKKVFENSCGDGNILTEVVKRYILDAKNINISNEKIKEGLEKDIFGAEIDKKHYNNCIKNLNDICFKYDIKNVSWNIFNKDILRLKINKKFDFIVGNPPYIKYHSIDERNRRFLRKNFTSCNKGNFDYCYAFIEYAINHLNKNGKMSYLIPNSIFKNISALNLRNIMLPNLKEIQDFIGIKVFEDALISPAIIIIDNKYNKDYIYYNNKKLKKKILESNKWMFSDNSKNNKSFSDYFKASVSIATQKNPVFVIKPIKEDNLYYHIDNFKIEKKLTRKTCSPKTINKKEKERLIFPYKYGKNGNIIRYTEKELEKKFPEAYKYLKANYNILMSRKKEKKLTMV